jgi:hypothetical protein
MNCLDLSWVATPFDQLHCSLPWQLQRRRQVLSKNLFSCANIAVNLISRGSSLKKKVMSHFGPLGAQNSPVLLISNPSMKDARDCAASSGVTAIKNVLARFILVAQ